LKEMMQDLTERANPRRLLKQWPDGRIKMYLTAKLLQFRRRHPRLFDEGEYIPLRVTGARADHVIAFARRFQNDWCLVAVPRLCASLTRAGTPPLGKKAWKDTRIEMPPEFPADAADIFTDSEVSTPRLSDLFATLPLAVIAVA